MTNFVAKSKLDLAEIEIARLTTALRVAWTCLIEDPNAEDCRAQALQVIDAALNGERP